MNLDRDRAVSNSNGVKFNMAMSGINQHSISVSNSNGVKFNLDVNLVVF